MGLESDIREIIANQLQSALSVNAKILKRNPFENPRDTWIGNFTFDDGGTDRTHAWFIRRNSVLKSTTDVFETHLYILSGFYGYDAGDDKGNSEDTFQENVDLVKDKLMNIDPATDIWSAIDNSGSCDSAASYSISFSPIGLIKASKTALVHFTSAEFMLKIQR